MTDCARKTAPSGPDDVIRTLLLWHSRGERAAIATVIRTWGSSPRPVGSRLAIREDGVIAGSVSGGCVEGAVILEASEVMASGRPVLLTFGVADDAAWTVGLSCGGRIEVFVEPATTAKLALLEAMEESARRRVAAALVTNLATGDAALLSDDDATDSAAVGRMLIELARARFAERVSGVVEAEGGTAFVEVWRPPPRLVIVGAVHIAESLVPIARLAGWDVAVIEPRPAFASPARFPGVAIVPDWPDAALARIGLDAATAVVTLSHDPKFDEPALLAALRSEAFYVGALGSRRTAAARRARLRARDLDEASLSRLHAPVGLPIGALSPAEIAVSIMAELTAAWRGVLAPRAAYPAMPRIAAIVLAAGASRRMGRNKLVEPVGGTPMVARAVDAALASVARPVVVVTGHEPGRVAAALGGRSVTLAHNTAFATGIASSIRTGIEALPDGVDGAVIVLADMPFLTGAAIDRLIAAFDPAAGRSICVPSRDGRRGNPVLWGRAFFAELSALAGDSGGRQLFERHAGAMAEVAVESGVLEDVDTPEALAAANI
ncbi:MAG: XdhC family protein [Bauldia sp.]|nr:XdhC family protein [Bauldia sp.]